MNLHKILVCSILVALFSSNSQAISKETITTWQKYTEAGRDALNRREADKSEQYFAAAFTERKKLPPYPDLLKSGYNPKMLMSTSNLDEVSGSLIVYYKQENKWDKVATTCQWILSDPTHVRLAVQANAWAELAEAELKLGKKEQAKKCYSAFETICRKIEPRKSELNLLDISLISQSLESYSKFLKVEGKISQSEDMQNKSEEFKKASPIQPLTPSK